MPAHTDAASSSSPRISNIADETHRTRSSTATDDERLFEISVADSLPPSVFDMSNFIRQVWRVAKLFFLFLFAYFRVYRTKLVVL
jgi:hypothetical protein